MSSEKAWADYLGLNEMEKVELETRRKGQTQGSW